MSARSSRRQASSSTVRLVLLFLVIGLFLIIGFCCGAYALLSRVFDETEPAEPVAALPALSVAYSPEKDLAFADLVDRFNSRHLETSDGQLMTVEAIRLDPESMINDVLDGTATFQAMTPDSGVWLGQLDQTWSEQLGDADAVAVGETTRYAVSPVVIATWEGLAREIGWPDRSVGWQDLLARAQTDPNFRWSHPSTSSASGLLATLAEFYAGAGKTRGLTIDDVMADATLEYVAELENTVRYYGEGNETAIIERALNEGRDFLDAFVVQEQMVVYFNLNRGPDQERLVALYPVEGALWEDHPLALLETTDLSPYHRLVYAEFRDFLLSPDAQQLILARGYRPADLSISPEGPDSPLTAANGVDPTEPKTTLQIPNASVIKVVRDAWWYTKRHTNVYLVVDTSGSMRGQKLAQAQMALHIFLDQILGDLERVGLIQFSSRVSTVVPLDELGRNRDTLEWEIDQLAAAGDTALLDGVYEAHRQLQAMGDTERINAIVVMTDGLENNSRISLRNLVRELSADSPIPVVVFSIAYGDDADMRTLQAVSEPTGGQVREGDLDTIQDLYKILSTYF